MIRFMLYDDATNEYRLAAEWEPGTRPSERLLGLDDSEWWQQATVEDVLERFDGPYLVAERAEPEGSA